MQRSILGPTLLAAAVVSPALAQPCQNPTWSPVGSGTIGSIDALTVYQGSLYAGGLMTSAGGVPGTSRIARWDGEAWHPLGQGLNGLIRDFLHHEGNLYVAGNFTSIIGGPDASRVAIWDGSSWSPLGSATLDGQVLALAVFNGQIHAAGTFTNAGGAAVSRVVRWNGTTWESLGGGVDSSAYALCVYDDGAGDGPALYVGGFFSHAGGVPISRIAKWDGLTWSDVGGGINGGVTCMAVFDDGSGPALYVGGNFTMAGGTLEVNSIARWDGNSWSRVGLLTGEFSTFSINTLDVLDDGAGPALYAGGGFINSEGQPVNHIAKWDGQTWTPLGAGTSSEVDDIAVFDDGRGGGPAIYAAGGFISAGGLVVNNIARYGCPPPPPCPADWDNDGHITSTDISAYLVAWLASVTGQTLDADFNGDAQVNSSDISAFLTAWLSAVTEGC